MSARSKAKKATADAAAAPTPMAAPAPWRPRIGVQLYTLRTEIGNGRPREIADLLDRVVECGYQWLELFGTPKLGCFLGQPPETLATMLSDRGLGVLAAHVPIEQLETDDLPSILDGFRKIGCADLVCPWLPPDRRGNLDSYRDLGASLQQIATTLGAEGFRLGYHNHDFELRADPTVPAPEDAKPAATDSGDAASPVSNAQAGAEQTGPEQTGPEQTGPEPGTESATEPDSQPVHRDGLTTLFTAAGSSVFAELDVFWLAWAGVDPSQYIGACPSPVRILHLKDGRLPESSEPQAAGSEARFEPLGDGDVDLRSVLVAARKRVINRLVVEQDECEGSPFDAIARSRGHLSSLLESLPPPEPPTPSPSNSEVDGEPESRSESNPKSTETSA